MFQYLCVVLADLLYSGDLHDWNGLSDAALPNGVLSNPIFDNIDYDVLTIGKILSPLILRGLTHVLI